MNILRRLSTKVKLETTLWPSPASSFLKKRSSLGFEPRSLIFLATPTLVNLATDDLKLAHEKGNLGGLQIIFAAVDTIAPSCHREGITHLWCNERLGILSSKRLEGYSETVNSFDWSSEQSTILGLKFGPFRLQLPIANTSFQTQGEQTSTMFYVDSAEDDLASNAGYNLSQLNVEVPDLAMEKVEFHDNLKCLNPDKELILTDCHRNLIKSINLESPAEFLRRNLSQGHRERVFVEVATPGNQDDTVRYEVVAGGGHGEKSQYLVLSPQAELVNGSIVRFLVHDTEADPSVPEEGIYVETSTEEETFNGSFGEEKVLQDCFGCGSENGFRWNGVSHIVPGESIRLSS